MLFPCGFLLDVRRGLWTCEPHGLVTFQYTIALSPAVFLKMGHGKVIMDSWTAPDPEPLLAAMREWELRELWELHWCFADNYAHLIERPSLLLPLPVL